MPDPLSTPRFALPLLAPGQAQKEITHNEALTLVDAMIGPRVMAVNAGVPPASPVAGQCWALSAAPSGVWTGQGLMLAIATAGNGWRFVGIPVGAVVTVESTAENWRRGPSGWTPPPLVPAPSGGPVIDSECRATVATLITALVAAGIVRTA